MRYGAAVLAPAFVLAGCHLFESEPPQAIQRYCIAFGNPERPTCIGGLPLSALVEQLRDRGAAITWTRVEEDRFTMSFSSANGSIGRQNTVLISWYATPLGAPKPACRDRILTATYMTVDGEDVGSIWLSNVLVGILKTRIDETRADAVEPPPQQRPDALQNSSSLASQDPPKPPSTPTIKSDPPTGQIDPSPLPTGAKMAGPERERLREVEAYNSCIMARNNAWSTAPSSQDADRILAENKRQKPRNPSDS